jgi:hypothetical protein
MNVRTGQNKFCGPAVLSILTGLDTDEAARAIQRTTGIRHEIKGVLVTDLIKTIEAQGLKVEKQVASFNCSLFRACYHAYANPGVYLVELPRHVVALEVTPEKKIYFCDNHTKESISIEASARLSQKVVGLWKVKIQPKFKVESRSKVCICSCCGNTHRIYTTWRWIELRYVAT